jgi:UPF0755 protein
MKKILVIVGLIVIAFFGLYFMMQQSRSSNLVDQTFIIETGDDLITVGRKLSEEKMISSRWLFYYYAWKEKLRGQIVAGEYQIAPNSSIAEIANKITVGDVEIQEEESVKITFPEGWTIEKMAQRLEKNNLPAEEFKQLAENPSEEILKEFAFIPADKSLEGFLFPDTYIFTADASAEEIINKMLTNFDLKVDSDMRDTLATENKSLYEILILASIIEGEVPTDADRGIIAGIFQNRLDIGMALQSDATLDFIKGEAEIKHSTADTQIDSPYNTYLYPGLPPGPINNPSLASIEAVINPTETDYMYFLNNATTGETVFSKSLEEHNSSKGNNGL